MRTVGTIADFELLTAVRRIAEAAEGEDDQAGLQTIREIAADVLAAHRPEVAAGDPRATADFPRRVAEALRLMKAASTRLRVAGRHASVEACGEAESVIRDLAALAGISVAAEQGGAAR